MLNCRSCERHLITNADHISQFAKELVRRIDMTAYGEPQVVNFGSGDKEGFTMVQLIETSNICAHFCNESGDMYLDVFSCKGFDLKVVKDLVYEYFKPTHINVTYTERQA